MKPKKKKAPAVRTKMFWVTRDLDDTNYEPISIHESDPGNDPTDWGSAETTYCRDGFKDLTGFLPEPGEKVKVRLQVLERTTFTPTSVAYEEQK